jgi:hypothetical protein
MVAQDGRVVVVSKTERAQLRATARKANEGFVKRCPDAWKEFRATVGRFKS